MNKNRNFKLRKSLFLRPKYMKLTSFVVIVFGIMTSTQSENIDFAHSALAATQGEDMDAAEREGIIFERQQIMLAIDADTKTLGGIVAGTVPASQLPKVTKSISENAEASVYAFEAKVPGGRSKPEVWSNHEAFLEDMQRFSRNAQTMAEAGENGDVNSVVNLMIDALPCKQCHDRYREPK